jgi:hypothetical protein
MASDLLNPLWASKKENAVCYWTDECQETFKKSQRVVSEKSLMVSFNCNLPLLFTCDISQYAVARYNISAIPKQIWSNLYL